MLVFIDDSGDPGFKLDRGSTSHFVIAMVCFDDELEAEKTAVAIKELKRALGFSEQEEFRFFKNSKNIRIKFLQAINKFDFRVRCLVVDKSAIYSDELKSNKNSFYAYFIKEVLKYSNNTISDAKVRMDGSGGRNFRKNFFTYLRRELNTDDKKIMRNCKMVNSKSNVLVQMADMIAGSINRAENKDKKDHGVYKDIIKNHIEDEWPFK
ncbi:DUF3800 domain-containing protein [Patescibacteria group bacterium]|nr:DUF3800 domain-containing protein [Patescibacteria group bacterium]MBU1921702.1 DUF3800 domain-containing protein [Patescibacteria group bacterium]